MLLEEMFVSLLLYDSETMIWKEKERSRIRAVQMDKLRGILSIRRMGVQNARTRELCGVAKWIDESVLSWFSNIERMEKGSTAKRVYVGEYVGISLVSRPRKRWIDSVNDCLKKNFLNVGQPRRMVYDMNEWRKLVRGNAWGVGGLSP